MPPATCRPDAVARPRRARAASSALRIASLANLGAYMAGAGGGVLTNQYIHLQGSVYRIPSIALHVVAVVTNTAPIGVTRGPGLRRGDQHRRAADRCEAARQHRHRSRRSPPPQHGAAPGDAHDQRLRLPEVDSGRFAESLDAGPSIVAPTARASSARRRAERGSAVGSAAWASPTTSRRPAARPTRTSTSGSKPTARSR
jgi:hypothetical protein